MALYETNFTIGDKCEIQRNLNIKADEPNANGRVYPREVIEKILTKAKSRTTFLYPTQKDIQREDLREAIGTVENFDIDEEGNVIIDCKILEHKINSPAVKMLQQGFVEITLCGKSLVDADNNIVQDFQLMSFGVIIKEKEI